MTVYKRSFQLLFTLVSMTTTGVCAQSIPLLTSATHHGHTTWSASIETLILMTLLMFLPAMLMTMTCFLRISIVLALLRQALGVAQTPSNQILIGVTLFLTLFIMSPVLRVIENKALNPYLDNTIDLKQALVRAGRPMHEFMLNQTRKDDLNFFVNLSHNTQIKTREDIPFSLLIPAYMTSELETAFQIGFLLFIPFLIIDLLVSSILMALGMMLVSPMVISLPLKIMLFVMINGWHLVFKTLAGSFFQP